MSAVPRFITHVAAPSLAPLAIVALYFTPTSLVSCANRGLIAFAVVLASLLAGIVMAVRAIRLRDTSAEASAWWILSAVILTTPALLVLGPLG